MTENRAESYAISDSYVGKRAANAHKTRGDEKTCETCASRVLQAGSRVLYLCKRARHPFNDPRHPFSKPDHPQYDPSARRAASVAWQDCGGKYWTASA